jgi:hypothetical protein
MATGQTLLTLASIVLLAIISMSIRSTYLQSVNNSVQTQYTSDALDYGRTLSERVQAYSADPALYSELVNDFGGLTDETDASSRLEYVSPAGETLYATVEISAEKVVLFDQMGREVTIRVYDAKNENDITLISEYVTVVVNLFES